jgi:3-deoxy-D-manno-octulosonate 8-phosphate phosphatase (KDO 8-P phosphatase)
MTNQTYPPDVWQRASRIRLLILDVDGVLTNGSLYFGPRDEVFKVFHVRDGHGIKMAQHGGIEVAFLSGRRSDPAFLRAKELGVTRYFEGLRDKVPVLEELCRTLNLTPENVAAVGDELVDLPLFHRVGLAVAVADAVPEVKSAAHWVTLSPGGQGAVREVTDLLLKATGAWEKLLAIWQPPTA